MKWWRGFLQLELSKQLGPVSATSAKKIMTDWNAMQYGLRCHLAIGGFKFRPPGLNREDLELRATGVINLIANILVQIRAAEDVIKHHGLESEYEFQAARAQAEIEKLMGPAPTQAEQANLMAAIRAVQKAGKKDGHILRFPGSSGEGNGVGEGRLPGDSREGGPEVPS